MAADLVLLSPMAGWTAALDEVPDPVFAELQARHAVLITGD